MGTFGPPECLSSPACQFPVCLPGSARVYWVSPSCETIARTRLTRTRLIRLGGRPAVDGEWEPAQNFGRRAEALRALAEPNSDAGQSNCFARKPAEQHDRYAVTPTFVTPKRTTISAYRGRGGK